MSHETIETLIQNMNLEDEVRREVMETIREYNLTVEDLVAATNRKGELNLSSAKRRRLERRASGSRAAEPPGPRGRGKVGFASGGFPAAGAVSHSHGGGPRLSGTDQRGHGG